MSITPPMGSPESDSVLVVKPTARYLAPLTSSHAQIAAARSPAPNLSEVPYATASSRASHPPIPLPTQDVILIVLATYVLLALVPKRLAALYRAWAAKRAEGGREQKKGH